MSVTSPARIFQEPPLVVVAKAFQGSLAIIEYGYFGFFKQCIWSIKGHRVLYHRKKDRLRDLRRLLSEELLAAGNRLNVQALSSFRNRMDPHLNDILQDPSAPSEGSVFWKASTLYTQLEVTLPIYRILEQLSCEIQVHCSDPKRLAVTLKTHLQRISAYYAGLAEQPLGFWDQLYRLWRRLLQIPTPMEVFSKLLTRLERSCTVQDADDFSFLLVCKEAVLETQKMIERGERYMDPYSFVLFQKSLGAFVGVMQGVEPICLTTADLERKAVLNEWKKVLKKHRETYSPSYEDLEKEKEKVRAELKAWNEVYILLKTRGADTTSVKMHQTMGKRQQKQQQPQLQAGTVNAGSQKLDPGKKLVMSDGALNEKRTSWLY